MKTALCISGQPRTIEQCIDSLVEFIVRPLDADVFFHMWETSRVPNYMENWYGKKVLWPEFDNDKLLIVLQKLNPKGWIIQPQIKFNESLFKPTCLADTGRMQAVNFQHLPSMLYSIKMANALKIRHEFLNDFRYDCVIRVRPDMKFAAPIPQECLKDLTQLYYFAENSFGGVNDQFAISNSANMDEYCDAIDHLPILFQNGCNYHPETIVKTNLDFRKVKYQGIETLGELIR